jgi:hypothetical protein
MSHNSIKAQAENKLKIADHLLSTTYTLVKDPKLLVSVIDALYTAMDLSINAILEFEMPEIAKKILNSQTISGHDQKRTFDKNFKTPEFKESEKLELFRRKIVTKYALEPEMVDFYSELKTTLETHRKSDVEFTKKEKFVISDKEYNLKTLTYEDVKKKYASAKSYVNHIFKIIEKYE